jgi:hypothetical protein
LYSPFASHLRSTLQFPSSYSASGPAWGPA